MKLTDYFPKTALAALLFSLLATPAAQAQVGFTFSGPATATKGGIETVYGTLTNAGAAPVYLNSGGFSIFSAPAGAVTDPNDPDVVMALSNLDFPLTLTPASAGSPFTYTGPLFDVSVSHAAPTGLYGLSFTITGGPDSASSLNLAQANLTQTLTSSSPVPEAGTDVGFGLMLLGLIGLGAVTRLKGRGTAR